jgi:two-component system, NarL family, nitrate/nitrite response regulator NarL
MNTIQIVLVDPHQLSREGLKRLLHTETGRVVGEAGTLEEARALIANSTHPDLLVVALADSSSEDQSPIIERIRTDFAELKVVIITSSISRPLLTQALSAGVKACLLRDMSTEALTQSLHLVMLGQQVFPTRVTMMLLGNQGAPRETASDGYAGSELPARMRGLSAREAQILRYLLSGYSNKVIARALGISEATVKVHLKALLRKVNAQNRTQAAVWALANGFAEERASPGGGLMSPAAAS